MLTQGYKGSASQKMEGSEKILNGTRGGGSEWGNPHTTAVTTTTNPPHTGSH